MGKTSPRHIINNYFSPQLIDNKDDQNVVTKTETPLVLSKLTSISNAWFIINLLSSVPFLSSLSFANTMDVLFFTFSFMPSYFNAVDDYFFYISKLYEDEFNRCIIY